VLILGFAAGVALSFFRQMYHLDINNAMATGSARFFGLWLYEALIKRKKTEKKECFTFVLYTILIVVFVLGASIYTWLSYVGSLVDDFWNLSTGNANFYVSELALIIICIIPYFFAPHSAFTKPQGKYGGGIVKEKENYGGGINRKS
jgi:ABC-type microcin C transport system permease subunit YejB